jgi:hypothetical protein
VPVWYCWATFLVGSLYHFLHNIDPFTDLTRQWELGAVGAKCKQSMHWRISGASTERYLSSTIGRYFVGCVQELCFHCAWNWVFFRHLSWLFSCDCSEIAAPLQSEVYWLVFWEMLKIFCINLVGYIAHAFWTHTVSHVIVFSVYGTHKDEWILWSLPSGDCFHEF